MSMTVSLKKCWRAIRWMALLVWLAPAAVAANFDVQVGPGNSYSPRNLTIQAGDSVTWRNQGGGQHNVRADDGSFICANGCNHTGGNGSVASNNWQFSLTFNDPATIRYFCDLHGAPNGIGMAGMITVEGSTGGDPGSVAFTQSNFNADEGDGSRSVTAQRTGGSEGAVSVNYATSDGSADEGEDYTAASGTLDWADGQTGSRSFSVPILEDGEEESNETVNVMLSNPTGGASLSSPSAATITIRDNDSSGGGSPGTLSLAGHSAGEGSGAAHVAVKRQAGSDGAVSVRFGTAEGSASEGADFEDTSGSVQWPSGDTEAKTIEVTVHDDDQAEEAETFNVALTNPTGGAVIGSHGTATVTIPPNDRQGEPCVADADTACVQVNGRFKVEVEFFDGTNAGTGQVIDIGLRDSTLFWFFDPNNAEMLVKVLNACIPVLGNKYWVFYAATTNVEFDLTITDTESGESQQYHNTFGNAADPIQDIEAFATCP